MSSKKYAILTGGGDCPGLNAVIRAITRRCLKEGHEVLGLLDGWKGLLEKNFITLDDRSVSGILHTGGTLLRTSRTNVLKDQQTIDLAFKNYKELKLDGIFVIGGEGTLTVASKMHELGMNIVSAPKTIDNDVGGTDFTFGFNTAVEVATQAIDRLHTTAESHNRVMVVEVMGRHAGWIACYAGIAGGADAVLIPEYESSVESICKKIDDRKKRGKRFSIVVVAEGAKLIFKNKEKSIHKNRLDDFGRPQLGGIGQALADAIEETNKLEARVTVLGYVQRGGTPTAHDRVLATAFGSKAADLAFAEKWGYMSSLQGAKVSEIKLKDAIKKLKTVNDDLWQLIQKVQ